ncbi:MAG: amidohydrolase family protein [Oscillospiraceae bacterium]|nr:amidohydrolase family protein [Oscillospiraceae bacterium]
MVIDMHVHPAFYGEICTPEKVKEHKKIGGYDLMGPFPKEETCIQMDHFGVDRLVLLPLDVSAHEGGHLVTNEEIRALMDLEPERFWGFASVDPDSPDALEVLDYAFKNLGLMGLKLNPSKQAFYPADPKMDAIYKKCIQYNKPILFHAGMSWEPGTLMKYSVPLNFEEVAVKYPQLRICLAHFGWPFAVDTAALCLKYPNVYTDTSAMYMDSPEKFMDYIFNQAWGPLWFQNNFAKQVMFGSNNPRFRTARVKRGLDSIEMRDDVREKLMGGNALRFLGMED